MAECQIVNHVFITCTLLQAHEMHTEFESF